MLIAFQQFFLFFFLWRGRSNNQKLLWNSKTHAQIHAQWLQCTTIGLDKGSNHWKTSVLLYILYLLLTADMNLFFLLPVVGCYQGLSLTVGSTWSVFKVTSQTDAARAGHQRGHQLPDRLQIWADYTDLTEGFCWPTASPDLGCLNCWDSCFFLSDIFIYWTKCFHSSSGCNERIVPSLFLPCVLIKRRMLHSRLREGGNLWHNEVTWLKMEF